MTLLCELCVSVLSALTIIAATFNAEAAETQRFAEMNCITFGAKPVCALNSFTLTKQGAIRIPDSPVL